MWEHTEKWKEKLSSKKEPELEDLENSQPINIAKKKNKKKKGGNTKGAVGQSLHKECDSSI